MIDKPNNLLAQIIPSPLGKIGEGPGFGPFPNLDFSGNKSLEAIANILSVVIGFITITAGVYFLFQFMIGAFGWMTSSGDKNRLSAAQDRIVHALIGIIIVVATYAIVSVIGTLLGLDILLQKPDTLNNLLKAFELK